MRHSLHSQSSAPHSRPHTTRAAPKPDTINTKRASFAEEVRAIATSRTGTGKWRRLRAQALKQAQANSLTHCPHCNQWLDYTTPYTPASAEADHIIPYSKGGQDTPDNIQIICRACNLTKSGGRTRKATPTPLTPETLIPW